MANEEYIYKETVIYDVEGNAINDFYPFSVDVKKASRVIAAPIETGQQSFDNKVIDPIRVVVKGQVYENSGAVAKIETLFQSREFKFFKLDAKNVSYENMILQNVSTVNDSRNPDIIEYELMYVEAMLTQETLATPLDSEKSDTVQTGNAYMSNADNWDSKNILLNLPM